MEFIYKDKGNNYGALEYELNGHTLSDPMECSIPGSSAHGIFQARVLEWVANCQLISFFLTSALKEISPGISLEGMMLKLKLPYFGHLMQRVDSLEKTLMLGGIGGRRRG